MEQNNKILIVDDERDLCEILQYNLESEGYLVKTVKSGEEALEQSPEEYDLIILDIMMGGISGFKVANILRKERKLEIPFIFLTARGEENDILTGFNLGADDYIAKPFSIREVIARVKAILKRNVKKSELTKKLHFRELEIDLQGKETLIASQAVDLTRKEFDILVLLMKNMDRYISREEILHQVWDDDVIVTDRNVDVNIARLRKKIGNYGQYIKGKSGYGYCFKND